MQNVRGNSIDRFISWLTKFWSSNVQLSFLTSIEYNLTNKQADQLRKMVRLLGNFTRYEIETFAVPTVHGMGAKLCNFMLRHNTIVQKLWCYLSICAINVCLWHFHDTTIHLFINVCIQYTYTYIYLFRLLYLLSENLWLNKWHYEMKQNVSMDLRYYKNIKLSSQWNCQFGHLLLTC